MRALESLMVAFRARQHSVTYADVVALIKG
jgi:hypothetical protein